MSLISLSNEIAFPCDSNESFLDAASRANVTMAYSCRTGRCSTCKCKVLDGESVALQEELGLSQQEKDEGWILSCVRTAVSDVKLDVEDLGGVTLPSVKTLPCRIQTLEKLAADVIKVVLRLPPSSAFTFLPGQYIDVIGQGGAHRSYSLAGANSAEKLIELHIRAVSGGVMSEYWFGQAKVNDLLRLRGPQGTFFLRNIGGLDLVFLATGTGIAPVLAILSSIGLLAEDNKPRSATVYWGGRTSADLYCGAEIATSPCRYVPVLSRAGDDWTGARGYVQDVLMADNPDLSGCVIYACGSDAMIHSAKTALLQAGLPERRFLSDAFVCSATT